MPREYTRLVRSRLITAGTACALLIYVAVWPNSSASAAPSLVQSQTNYGTNSSITSTTLSPAATAGNLLVAVCSSASAAGDTLTGPSGFSVIINETTNTSQGIFYKIAAGGETTLSCNSSGSVTLAIQVFEYSGMHSYNSVEASSSSGANTGTTISSGSVITTHANDLLIASATNTNGSTISGWTGTFSSLTSFGQTGGPPSKRGYFSTASRTVSSTGTYSTTATNNSSAVWRGQIVAFRSLATSQSLSTDIVDGSGASVTSPSVSIGSITSGFSCQTTTGTLGTSTQKIRVTNNTDNPAWTLGIAATGGPSATWVAGTKTYKFNDPTGSGCTNGQLSADATVGTLAAQTNCSTSGITKGSATFSGGVTDSITLLSASSPADIDCYWELTGVQLSQKVPSEQPSGSYSLGLTMTVTAN